MIDQNLPYRFLSGQPLNFSPFTAQVRLFFVRGKDLTFSNLKMWWREESEKFSILQYVKLHVKFSGK